MAEIFALAERNTDVTDVNDYKNEEVGKFLNYHPYGLSFPRSTIYNRFGGRPVLYMSHEDQDSCPESLIWRFHKFELCYIQGSTDWTHEREWRTPIDVDFDNLPMEQKPSIIVPCLEEKDILQRIYAEVDTKPFKDIIVLPDLLSVSESGCDAFAQGSVW